MTPVSEVGLVNQTVGLETTAGSYIIILNNRTNDRTPAGQDGRQSRKDTIIVKMDANLAKTEAKLGAYLQKPEAWLEKMKARWEVTEAHPEKREENTEEMKSVLEHQEVPKEETAVETIEALEDWYGNQCLTVGRHGRLMKWTQGHGGVTAEVDRRWLAPRAIPAPRDKVIRDQPRTTMHMEPLKDGRSRRDVRRDLNRTMA